MSNNQVYMVTVNNGSGEVRVFFGVNQTDEFIKQVNAQWHAFGDTGENKSIYSALLTPSILDFLGNPVDGVWYWYE